MTENALCSPVPENRNTSRESQLTLTERLEDLESKTLDLELLLAASLPLTQRRSGSLVSWLRAFIHKCNLLPKSFNNSH